MKSIFGNFFKKQKITHPTPASADTSTNVLDYPRIPSNNVPPSSNITSYTSDTNSLNAQQGSDDTQNTFSDITQNPARFNGPYQEENERLSNSTIDSQYLEGYDANDKEDSSLSDEISDNNSDFFPKSILESDRLGNAYDTPRKPRANITSDQLQKYFAEQSPYNFRNRPSRGPFSIGMSSQYSNDESYDPSQPESSIWTQSSQGVTEAQENAKEDLPGLAIDDTLVKLFQNIVSRHDPNTATFDQYVNNEIAKSAEDIMQFINKTRLEKGTAKNIPPDHIQLLSVEDVVYGLTKSVELFLRGRGEKEPISGAYVAGYYLENEFLKEKNVRVQRNNMFNKVQRNRYAEVVLDIIEKDDKMPPPNLANPEDLPDLESNNLIFDNFLLERSTRATVLKSNRNDHALTEFALLAAVDQLHDARRAQEALNKMSKKFDAVIGTIRNCAHEIRQHVQQNTNKTEGTVMAEKLDKLMALLSNPQQAPEQGMFVATVHTYIDPQHIEVPMTTDFLTHLIGNNAHTLPKDIVSSLNINNTFLYSGSLAVSQDSGSTAPGAKWATLMRPNVLYDMRVGSLYRTDVFEHDTTTNTIYINIILAIIQPHMVLGRACKKISYMKRDSSGDWQFTGDCVELSSALREWSLQAKKNVVRVNCYDILLKNIVHKFTGDSNFELVLKLGANACGFLKNGNGNPFPAYLFGGLSSGSEDDQLHEYSLETPQNTDNSITVTRSTAQEKDDSAQETDDSIIDKMFNILIMLNDRPAFAFGAFIAHNFTISNSPFNITPESREWLTCLRGADKKAIGVQIKGGYGHPLHCYFSSPSELTTTVENNADSDVDEENYDTIADADFSGGERASEINSYVSKSISSPIDSKSVSSPVISPVISEKIIIKPDNFSIKDTTEMYIQVTPSIECDERLLDYLQYRSLISPKAYATLKSTYEYKSLIYQIMFLLKLSHLKSNTNLSILHPTTSKALDIGRYLFYITQIESVTMLQIILIIRFIMKQPFYQQIQNMTIHAAKDSGSQRNNPQWHISLNDITENKEDKIALLNKTLSMHEINIQDVLLDTLNAFLDVNPDILDTYPNITFDELFQNAQHLLTNYITEENKLLVLNKFKQEAQKGSGLYKKKRLTKKKRTIKRKRLTKKKRTIKRKRLTKKKRTIKRKRLTKKKRTIKRKRLAKKKLTIKN